VDGAGRGPQRRRLDDPLDLQGSAQRLRTALSLDGERLPAVLSQANERLMALRVDQPHAAGLIIAADQDHARGIARLLHQRHGVTAAVATSDDPAASQRIATFADGAAPWLVAVRMVSEGVDIPRLRLGVFATTTTTELFFRQAVGRFVRHTGRPARDERAWLFIPDDHRLRRWADTITEQRRHSLRRTWEEGGGRDEDPDPSALDEAPEDDAAQLSLFEVHSAQVIDGEGARSTFDVDPDAGPPDEVAGPDEDVAVDLPPPPPLGAGRFTGGLPDELAGRPLAEVKVELRSANADLAKELARYTGLSHREVNGRLNRLAAVERIADATVEQLQRRAAQAERWMAAL